MKNIAVFFGGVSVEHDVSVLTGVMAVNCLDKELFTAIPVYVDRSGKWYTGEILKDPDAYKNLELKKLKQVTFVAGENALYVKKDKKLKLLYNVYCVINCMHGERGEDGSLSGVLNMCGVANASPGIYSSALAMDKFLTKLALKGAGISVLPYRVINCEKDLKTPLKFGFPVVVKPVCGGSSIGVSVAENAEELYKAAAHALRFDDRAIIEPCLKGFTEINCAAYKKGDEIKVSLCEKPIGRTGLLTFADKYENGKREFPADILSDIAAKIRNLTERVYKTFSFTGIIRIDYFVKDDKVYLNEINSVPGSLSYYLFGDTVSGFKRVLTEIVETANEQFSQKQTIQKTFNSGILSFCGTKGAKRL